MGFKHIPLHNKKDMAAKPPYHSLLRFLASFIAWVLAVLAHRINMVLLRIHARYGVPKKYLKMIRSMSKNMEKAAIRLIRL